MLKGWEDIFSSSFSEQLWNSEVREEFTITVKTCVMGAEDLPMRTPRGLAFNVSRPYVVQFLGNKMTLG